MFFVRSKPRIDSVIRVIACPIAGFCVRGKDIIIIAESFVRYDDWLST